MDSLSWTALSSMKVVFKRTSTISYNPFVFDCSLFLLAISMLSLLGALAVKGILSTNAQWLESNCGSDCAFSL